MFSACEGKGLSPSCPCGWWRLSAGKRWSNLYEARWWTSWTMKLIDHSVNPMLMHLMHIFFMHGSTRVWLHTTTANGRDDEGTWWWSEVGFMEKRAEYWEMSWQCLVGCNDSSMNRFIQADRSVCGGLLTKSNRPMPWKNSCKIK